MVPSKFLAACALAWLTVACSSSDGSGPADAAGASDSSPEAATDARPVNDAADANADDALAPATPTCQAGDRAEWAGTIPSTAIAVAVCSTCGESYVVASNGSSSASDVSIDNGKKTVTTTVPAGATVTTANLADDPTNGTVTVCAMSGSQCLPVAPENKQYCNPFRAVTSLTPERIDQGVDYGGAGSIYALGPGTIDVYINRTDTGWPGGTFVSYKLSDGPASGKVIYLAENIDLDPALHSGSFVFSGTVLGTLVNASPDSESGWGVPGEGYTAEYSCYTEGCTTALGINFNDLLVCLNATSGIMGQTGCCTSSTGYPTDWCPLVAAWQ